MNGLENCFTNKDRILGEFGIRDMHPKEKGVFINRHVHNYGHLEEVIRGSIRLVMESPEIIEKEMKQGDAIYIPAGVHHTAEALEDDTLVRCIFHVRYTEIEADMANYREFS